jgi:hypothetical protein
VVVVGADEDSRTVRADGWWVGSNGYMMADTIQVWKVKSTRSANVWSDESCAYLIDNLCYLLLALGTWSLAYYI